MERYVIHALGRSKAGHDRDRYFVIVGEEDDWFWLADGKGRTLAHPKKKNRLHVQPVIHLDGELDRELRGIREDADIRRVLKRYQDSRQ